MHDVLITSHYTCRTDFISFARMNLLVFFFLLIWPIRLFSMLSIRVQSKHIYTTQNTEINDMAESVR